VPTDLIAFPENTEGYFLMAGSGDHSGFMFDADITNVDSFATFDIADRATTDISPLKKSASMDFCETQSDNIVVCITEEWEDSPGGILTTTDGGINWELKDGYDSNVYNKSIIAMSSDDPDNIIALNNNHMLYTDNGDNFYEASGTTSNNPSCTIPYTINCLGASDLAGTNINESVFGAYRNITADKNYGCVFYYYDWDKTFSISTNGGESWCIVNDSDLPVSGDQWSKSRLISIPGANHEGHLWININNDLYHSTDAGATWINCTTSNNYSVNKVKALSFGKGMNATYEAIYIYGSIDGEPGDFFYRSDDNGITWLRINDHSEKELWGDNKIIAGDRVIAGRLYATASGQGVLFGDSDITSTCDNSEKTTKGEFDDINSPTIPDWTVSDINGATMTGSINNWTKAVLEIGSAGNNDFDLQLWQDDLTMEADQVYLIQLDLRSDDTRQATIKLRNKSNGTTYLERELTIEDTAQEYAFLIKPDVLDDDLRLTLMVGGNASTVYVDHIRFKEYCDGDVTELECLDFITLDNHNILSDTYSAKTEIQSNGNIVNNQDVDYHAGETILLEAGFEVQQGVSFSAEIIGCP
jgi:photosystem II stability/assembly factor-like uncharacterized protein